MPQVSAKGLITDNPFFKEADYTFENFFKSYTGKHTKFSKYIVLAPKYTNIDLENIDFDPVVFFKNELIKKLKSKSISLIFNCSMEGSRILFPYFNIFTNSLLRNNIPLQNFYYLTGDPNEHCFDNSGNIFHVNSLDRMMRPKEQLNTVKDFYFTCLNRKPRYWRSKLIYELYHTDYKHKMLASHPTINSKNDFMNHDGFDVEDNIVEFFINNSPLQVSHNEPLSDTMAFNSVISTLPEVYNRAVFDVAMETYQERDHEYITEKTFKPMLNMMPVLIWGTPGINTTALKRLGFKLYEDWFDLSFDTEPDTEKRIKLLLNEILRVCKKLDNCSDLIEWQQTNMDVLHYNKNLILNLLPTNIDEFSRLYNRLDNFC